MVTGRLSSTDPNIQNIPRPGNDKFMLRHAFVADPGYILIVADYEQLEMRVMAHCSQDKNMLSAIRDGVDLHCYTVSRMFGVDYEEVISAKRADEPTVEQKKLKELRQAAKAIGFGLIYGIGARKLGHNLTKDFGRLVTQQEAKNLMEKYFQVFEGTRFYIKNTKKECKESSLVVKDSTIPNSGAGVPFVNTITGRFRRLPQINARNKFDSSQAERQSVNSIIQGTAADIAKFAMLKVNNDDLLKSLGIELLLQVHDELIFQCPDDPSIIERGKGRIKELMEHPFDGFELDVPIPTTCDYAYSWGDAK